MAGWAGGLQCDGGFPVVNDAIANLMEMHPQPLRGAARFSVVGGAVAVDAARL